MQAGLASLPVTGGVFIAAAAASQLIPRIGPKPLMVIGGLARHGRPASADPDRFATPASAPTCFPAELLLGLGLGFIFVPLSNLALVGVPNHDAGAASATLNATQQVGGSLGTAFLATLSVGAITNYITDVALSGGDPSDPAVSLQAQVEGYTTAFTWASVLLVLGAVVSAVLIKATKEDLPDEAVVHAA